jgi:hypothetical protein
VSFEFIHLSEISRIQKTELCVRSSYQVTASFFSIVKRVVASRR